MKREEEEEEKMEKKMAKGDESRKKRGSLFSSISTIFKHADTTDRWLMGFGLIGAVGDGLSGPVMLYITSELMNNLDNGISSSSYSIFNHEMAENSLHLFLLACGSFFAAFLEGYCWTRTGERQASTIRVKYLQAVLRQDVEHFDLQGASTSEVINNISNDSLVIQDVISEKVPNFIMNLSMFLGNYGTGFFLMWRLALVALPTVLLLIIPGIMCGRILVNIAKEMREEYSKATCVVEQAISSVRTVYSFVGERKTMEDFSAALDGSVKLGLRQGLIKGLAIGSNGVTFAIWSFFSWYGSKLVMHHGGHGGTVFAVGAGIIFGGMALGTSLSCLKSFSEAISAGERIMEIVNRVPKIDIDSKEGEILENVHGEVEFKRVDFAYPSRLENLILYEFSLNVPAGMTVALVGGSGSGKSTVIALLERFYDPLHGEVLLDGVNIKKLKLKWLRSQMGLVSQEPALFATSIKENILFGKENASMDEVVAAAKASNAHNFISQLPQGYDTQVGERGVQMSGGQKQRIAIARALIKSPKILLLDEATSALDSESERIVQEALDKASLGRTTIIITHRLSTIRNANLIAVIEAGKVIETGNNDELIENKNGLYSKFIHLQQSSKTSGVVEVNPSTSMHASIISNKHDSNTQSISKLNSEGLMSSNELQQDQSEKSQMKPPAPSFYRLLMINMPEWKQAIIGILSAASFGAVQPIYAYVLGAVISVYFLKDHKEMSDKIRIYSLIFLSLSFVTLLLNVVHHYNFGAMGEYLTKRVRETMLSKMLTFEVGWFDQDENSTGSICSRLAKDANVVRSLVGDRMSLLIQTFSTVTIACTMGLVIAWRLALVLIAVQPLIIICFYARKMLLKNMSGKAIKAQSESSKIAAEAVSNLRTVTAFSSQDHILHFFKLAQEGPKRESVRQSWYAGFGLGFSQSLMICTWSLSFWFGGKLISNGYITVKEFLQTFLILVSTGRIIAEAGTMTSDIAKGGDAVGSVFEVLDRYSHIEPENPEGYRPKKLIGNVDICGVDFAYPARLDVVIFKNFSLSIAVGKSTALVGQSGSGKSTIIGLIERFYDPLKGTINIDGKDIKTYHLRALRQHIALVGQEPTLFAGTIKENIKYGCEEATEAEVEAAARVANAHDFISCLRDGYGTSCGDRGVQLSGGQKQRIAIARAILKNPAILLLDEATSALDSQSEKVVQEALERVTVGRTSVVVAHRLSTIQNCDLIAVLEKGMVVEKGSHASLFAKGPSGSYFSLVSLQQGSMDQ
ncbi:putative multidrug resistance protein [Dioscorea cayenensis subsp. rotundata]|uniref:Multidrug resistance protein n=1 Tax=Dioscorea cayennensis subsp. rotundata TaxID=55577 RepID=A0AB40CVF9_DIOCR|nr:putative multidrug resistance protein [Dioscorea cayenensis subsp. rotundata]